MDILRSGFLNYRKWKNNPRYWIVALFLLVFTHSAGGAFREVSIQSGQMLSPWLLPFLFTDRFLLFCFSLCLIMTFCDAPFLDTLQPYSILKVGRTKWMFGQLLYIVTCCFLFFLVAWVFELLFCVGRISFTADWGDCLKMLARNNPFWGTFQPDMIIPKPAIATSVQTFLMCWMIGSVLAALLLLLNLYRRREIGALLVAGISVMDFVSFAYADETPSLFWISPISWMNPKQYVQGGQWMWPVRFAIAVLLLLLLSSLIFIKFRKSNIQSAPEL